MPWRRMTILQLVAAMPIAAVLAREVRWDDGLFERLTTYAVVSLLPSFILRLDRARAVTAAAASAAVFAMLAIGGYGPNRAAIVGCLVLALIARFARDLRDLNTALLAVGIGVNVGCALDDPCTPIGVFAGPLAGIAIRYATRPATRESAPGATAASPCPP